MTPQEHYPALKIHFETLSKLQKQIPLTAKAMLDEFEGDLYVVHFFLFSGLNRTLNLTDSLLSAVATWNFTSTAILLRCNLETLAVFTYILNSPNATQLLVEHLTNGRLKKIEVIGSDTKLISLKGYELIDYVANYLPWTRKIYKETSNVVHFSDKHFYTMATAINEEEHQLSFAIQVGNESWPEENIKELLEACVQINQNIVEYSEKISRKFKKSLAQGSEKES